MVDTDACTNACEDPACGDGIVHEGVEECDDASMDNFTPFGAVSRRTCLGP